MTNTNNTDTNQNQNPCWQCRSCGWVGHTPESGRQHWQTHQHTVGVHPDWQSPDPEWGPHPSDWDCGDED